MKKLIVSLVLCVMLFAPFSAKALTTDELILSLKEQIAVILAKIIDLQTQLLVMVQEQQAQALATANLQTTVNQQTQNIGAISEQIANPPAPKVIIKGCVNPEATNYNSLAEEDDGSCVMPIDPLVFTETPKLVWKNIGSQEDPMMRMSYLTWQTSRPSKLILSPVMAKYDNYGKISDWTTDNTCSKSCNNSCSFELSKEVKTTCTIKVEDDHGVIAEYQLNISDDSVELTK